MDPASAFGSILAAFGLSGAAGLNAWLPLLGGALLARLGVVDLAGPFDHLTHTPWLVALGGFTALDFVGDKVPAVDSVLHAVGTVVAPTSGAVLFTGQADLGSDLPSIVSIVLGAVTAGSIHLGRTAARPASTASTGGMANPVVSLVEDVIAVVLVALAFLAPIVAAVAVVALVVALGLGARKLTRFVRRRAAPARSG